MRDGSVQVRIIAALTATPDASAAELATSAGASIDYVRQVLRVRRMRAARAARSGQ